MHRLPLFNDHLSKIFAKKMSWGRSMMSLAHTRSFRASNFKLNNCMHAKFRNKYTSYGNRMLNLAHAQRYWSSKLDKSEFKVVNYDNDSDENKKISSIVLHSKTYKLETGKNVFYSHFHRELQTCWKIIQAYNSRFWHTVEILLATGLPKLSRAWLHQLHFTNVH